MNNILAGEEIKDNREIQKIFRELHERLGKWERVSRVFGLKNSTGRMIGIGLTNPGGKSLAKIKRYLPEVEAFLKGKHLPRKINTFKEMFEYLEDTEKILGEWEEDVEKLQVRIERLKRDIEKTLKHFDWFLEEMKLIKLRIRIILDSFS